MKPTPTADKKITDDGFDITELYRFNTSCPKIKIVYRDSEGTKIDGGIFSLTT